jgi:hypothetical protein
MSKLSYHVRPTVAFDVANKEHRRHYHEFAKNNTWGRCPVRFISLEDTGYNLVAIMQRQIVEYYTTREFKE